MAINQSIKKILDILKPIADVVRYGCYVVSIGLMYPWFQQLNKIGLLGGGLEGIEPATTKVLLYMSVGYPFFLLGCVLLSLWSAAQKKNYSAVFISALPLIYFYFMVVIAQKLVAAVTAVMKGRMAAELVEKIPFEYMVPGPVPIVPGRMMKEMFRGFF